LRARAGRLRLISFGLCRGKRKARGVVEQLPFLRRELVETSGFKSSLPRIGRHGAQALYGISDCLLPLRGQAPELRIYCTELLLLLRSQVLPGFHTVKDLLLPLWRQRVEVLQPLFELLLPAGRQATKVGIALKSTPLLVERLLTLLVEPLPGMMALRRWLVWPRHIVAPRWL
jgi:hypothetical protein